MLKWIGFRCFRTSRTWFKSRAKSRAKDNQEQDESKGNPRIDNWAKLFKQKKVGSEKIGWIKVFQSLDI